MMSFKVCAYTILSCIQFAITMDPSQKKPIDPPEIEGFAASPLQADDIMTYESWLSKHLWNEVSQVTQNKQDNYIIDDPEELENFYLKMESLINLNESDKQEDRYFNPVDSTWQESTTKRISENMFVIKKHYWPGTGKLLLDKVVIPSTVEYKDGNSLFKALSFWLTGSIIYHNPLKKILENFMSVDERVMEFKAEKRNYINSAAMEAKKEVQCAAFLLNTSIMVYDQNDKIWQSYYKDLNNKKIGDKEQCIYIRHVGGLHYDIVSDVIDEIDTGESLKRMDERDNNTNYLLDSPYKDPKEKWKEISENVKKGANSGNNKLSEVGYFKNPGLGYSRAFWQSDVSTEKNTNRWFNPVNTDWQKRITTKFKLPFSKPHDYMEKKKLISYPIIHDIVGDGNCLFRSLSYWVTGSEGHYAKMRDLIVNFMKSDEKINNYFNGHNKRDLHSTIMAEDGTWGTENEIIATAILLETSIYVFAARYRTWVLYNKDIENNTQPGEDEMCIYIRNLPDLHFDVVVDIGNKEMYWGFKL